jgi:hypothetical protein
MSASLGNERVPFRSHFIKIHARFFKEKKEKKSHLHSAAGTREQGIARADVTAGAEYRPQPRRPCIKSVKIHRFYLFI